jgi:hypothetical protein
MRFIHVMDNSKATMNYPAASSGVSKTPTLKADFAASGGELTPKEIK